ncbi:CoA transferase [Mycolicibacterium murale]|uniref:CoA transferase n=2 Tax=Mycolicibacterium murale TaxID=182220 RepID=A0A7I9WW20_9MYCO|nr:CoA transferase [Mycolicibacterium murale]
MTQNLQPMATFQPLAGIRVIDFTRVLAGPYATMLLAELGADVIKIEMPQVGDETRAWGPPFVDHTSAYFHAVNRGKRSVVLDLTGPQGRAAVDSLIGTADVVVENFRPGVTERLGIAADEVVARHPSVIYGSITGFGTTGPMAQDAGTEVIVEAESGLMSITGAPGQEPVRFGVAMVDLATGAALVNAVLAALVERGRTGRGRRVDVSLYATAVSALGTVIAGTSAGGGATRAWGSAHPSIVPYRAFTAVDGHVVLGATNDAMFTRLVDALDAGATLGRREWAGNAARVSARAEVDAAIQDAVGRFTVAELLDRLRAHRVLVAPVRTPAEAARSAQAAALGLITDDGGLLIPRSPLGPIGTRELGRAPDLGEHTDAVLAEIGDSIDAKEGV